MGANASSIPAISSITELDDVPESCIALVLSYLDPPEIAKLAAVNRTFQAASSADFIWRPKLPSTSPYLLSISKFCYQGIEDKRSKDIYAALCRRSTFDGGTKVRILWLYRVLTSLYLDALPAPFSKFSVLIVMFCFYGDRKFGLIREAEAFAWLFLLRRWRSPELMIGGTGIIFQLMNLGTFSSVVRVCVCFTKFLVSAGFPLIWSCRSEFQTELSWF